MGGYTSCTAERSRELTKVPLICSNEPLILEIERKQWITDI